MIDEWEAKTPPKAVAKLDQRLNFLKDRPTTEWHYEYAHPLTNGDGVWEIKFEWGNVAYRPLFYFGPFPEEFTILVFSEERDGKLVPGMGAAVSRMAEVKSDPNKALMHDG